MGMNYRLWEMASLASLLKPAADAAGRTSTYVSLANALKAYVLCYINQGNAATVQLSVLQATSQAGAGSKALSNPAPIAYDLDCDSTPSDALSFTTGTSYTTDAGLKTKLVVFEIEPAEVMDLADGFNHIAIQTGASNAANITSAVVVVTPLRNQAQQPPTINV